MKYLYLLLIMFFIANLAIAQRKGSVSGSAYDSVLARQVSDATVTILDRKDSSLVSFGMTNSSGWFKLTELADGDYRMLITHINYHNLSRNFSIKPESRDAEMGQLAMIDKSVTLQEVIVNAEAPPVTLVGDTVQYHADAFKTQPNASVEQLLKKLPGVQVDKNGNIKAQGQNVSKVLVDGREFFGNDPKMATKNLTADAIDKVQVYDKVSDQSQLTGFDDGNSERTINLKLKKERKKGVFGKVAGAVGTKERMEGRFNVNSFKGARQFSVIGTGNNTNVEGFSFNDLLNFTGDLGRIMRGGGGNISQDQMAAMAGSSSTNQGIRSIWGTGVNYNNIIGEKLDLTSNYFYNHFNPRTTSELQRTYLLPDSTYNFKQSGLSDVRNSSHRLNLSFDYQIDSFHSLKISPSIGLQNTRSRSANIYEQSGSDSRVSNRGYNNVIRDNDAGNLRNDLLLRKKFRKKGRTISFSLQTVLNNSEGDGNQESVNDFFAETGVLYRTDSINQRIRDEAEQKGYTGRIVYTEPLFRKSLMEFSIGKSSVSSWSSRQTFDYDKSSGNYDRVNDSLTNNFENEYGYSTAGFRVRTQLQKLVYSAGVNWQRAELTGKVITGIKDTILKTTFHNMLPTARVQYNFNRSKNMLLHYSTYTQQPTITQLQPVPDISNPLNIREGNPDLKQEFVHNLQLRYSGVNPFRNKTLFITVSGSRINNKIVNSDSVFSNGVKKTRPVNVNAVYSSRGDISLGLPVRFIKGTLQFGTTISYNNGKQFINGAANTINDLAVGPRISLNINPNDRIDWMLGASMDFNRTTYSLRPSFNTNYFSQVYETEFNWDLPLGFYLGSELIYTINNQRASGFNASVPLWNASLARQIFKSKRAQLKLRVNDILNRNVGVTRTSNQNYIEDSRVNTLKRYALLTVTYNLTKTGSGTQGGKNIIIR